MDKKMILGYFFLNLILFLYNFIYFNFIIKQENFLNFISNENKQLINNDYA